MFRKTEKRHNRPADQSKEDARDEVFRRRFQAAMRSSRFWL